MKLFNAIKPLALVLPIVTAISARGDFSNNVQALNPVAYWMLNETTAPPDGAPPTFAANLGTLGHAQDGTFSGDNVDVIYGYPGALASSSDTADSFNGFSTRVLAPYATDLGNAPSFTIEAWLLAHDDGRQFGTTCPLSDVNAGSTRSGWLIYMDVANQGQYTFRTYNTNGGTPSLSLNLGAAGSILMETWYHVAVVVSNAVTATNVYGYINGALVAGPVALPSYVPNDGANGGFSIGGRTDNDGFDYVGAADEVAYYSNALDPSAVLAHYQAGTNPSPSVSYSNLVQQSHPLLYFRLDEVPTALAGPYLVPLPVATNRGSLGALINGYYQPGTMPGVAGPTNAGFGPQSRACQFGRNAGETGINGPGVLCDPYNQPLLSFSNGLTLAAWIQVPATNVDHFTTVVGRSDESYRFDIDTSGNPHFAANPNGDVVGANLLNDGLWHFWVGTFDPVTSSSYLYIDGLLAAKSPGSPLQQITTYFFVGGAPDYTDRYFVGSICHMAIFSNALSAAQIEQLYTSVGAAPTAVLPTNAFTLNQGANGGIAAAVNGTPPLGIQWYYIDTSSNINISTGETTATLSLTNVQPSQSGWQYFVVVSNFYGIATSSVATLTVVQGPPQIQTDISPLLQQVPVGVPVTYCIVVTGTQPFHYQWFKNGSTLIPGATNSCYTFNSVAGSNTYSVTVTNNFGPANSATAAVVGLTTPPPVITFNNASDWSVQGNVTTGGFSNNVLTLTDGTNSEAESAFLLAPQYIGGFAAFFTYQEADGTAPLADGTTFCIQNSSSGATAVGGGGGDLGYYGISPSAAFEINIYNGANGGRGIQFGTNGATADSPNPTGPYFSPGSVNVASANPINVRLYYIQNTLYVLMADSVAGTSYNAAFNVGDLTAVVSGADAYIGFTGATGGLNAIQKVSNFRFSYTTPPVLSIMRSGTTTTLTWPVSVATFFVLQQSPTITGPWTNVGTAPTIVNGQNQVMVSGTAATQYFRLKLQ
jgi:hypothetical protein